MRRPQLYTRKEDDGTTTRLPGYVCSWLGEKDKTIERADNLEHDVPKEVDWFVRRHSVVWKKKNVPARGNAVAYQTWSFTWVAKPPTGRLPPKK